VTSGELDEMKDSCPFYDLDDILEANACGNPTDVVNGRNVDLQSDKEECFALFDIHTLPCVYTVIQSKMIVINPSFSGKWHYL